VRFGGITKRTVSPETTSVPVPSELDRSSHESMSFDWGIWWEEVFDESLD